MSLCVHISREDIERYFAIDEFDVKPEEAQFYHDFMKKVMTCSECKTKYMLAVDSKVISDSYKVELGKYLLSSVADIVESKLYKFESVVKDRMQSWLTGSKELLNSFDTVVFGSAQYALATRGETETAAPKIIELNTRDCSCDFEIQERTKVIFKIPRITDEGEPVCLVIEGRNDTEFEEVYELSGLDLPGIRSSTITSPTIELNQGEYTLYVPILKN